MEILRINDEKQKNIYGSHVLVNSNRIDLTFRKKTEGVCVFDIHGNKLNYDQTYNNLVFVLYDRNE